MIARAYGFKSWTRLKLHVDGITIKRLVESVRGNNRWKPRRCSGSGPELAKISVDNMQPLHHAVLNRAPELVRLLMRNGANARAGVYPHRDATSPVSLAHDRGYADIVSIIEAEEKMRRTKGNIWPPLHTAAGRLDLERVAALSSEGADARMRGPGDLTPLDAAAYFSGRIPLRHFPGSRRCCWHMAPQ